MKTLRNLIGILGLVLVGVGYFASQAAMMAGSASLYAWRVDGLTVRLMAAIVFLGAIAFAFVPTEEGE